MLQQSVFLSAEGKRPGPLWKAMQQSTSAQGQSLSCGFFCNGIAWLPVKDYHQASRILTDAYLLSHKCQLPEHLYTLAPSDSSTGLSIWQSILCPQPPLPPLILIPAAKKWASSILDLSSRNKIQSPSLGCDEHKGWIWERFVYVYDQSFSLTLSGLSFCC